jgi:hypothetical protein
MPDNRKFKGRAQFDLSQLGDALGGSEVTPMDPSEVPFDDATFDARTQVRFKPKHKFANFFSGGEGSKLANELNTQQILKELETKQRLASAIQEMQEADKIKIAGEDRYYFGSAIPEKRPALIALENDFALRRGEGLPSDTNVSNEVGLGKAFTGRAYSRALGETAKADLQQRQNTEAAKTVKEDVAQEQAAKRAVNKNVQTSAEVEQKVTSDLGAKYLKDSKLVELGKKQFDAASLNLQNQILAEKVKHPDEYENLADGSFKNKKSGFIYKFEEGGIDDKGNKLPSRLHIHTEQGEMVVPEKKTVSAKVQQTQKPIASALNVTQPITRQDLIDEDIIEIPYETKEGTVRVPQSMTDIDIPKELSDQLNSIPESSVRASVMKAYVDSIMKQRMKKAGIGFNF